MNSTTPLTDELTGKAGIQTDHGPLGFGDLVVLLLNAVLLVYTGWRSFDFLSTTVPTGYQILALVGLWGLDIGALAWSLVWIFGSSETYQDWVSMAFFIVDLTGVVLTSLTDSLMYGKGGAMANTFSGIATVVIPLIVVGNVVSGFTYHFVSPETKARRAARKANAAHKERMQEIQNMERDLTYAEQYLLAKQDTLEKAVLLSDIKVAQDAIEKETRVKLRDQIGAYNAAKVDGNTPSPANALDQLRQRLSALKAQNGFGASNDNPPAKPVAPQTQIPSADAMANPSDPYGFGAGNDKSLARSAESQIPIAGQGFDDASSRDREPVAPFPIQIPTAGAMVEAVKKNGNGHSPDPFS